MEKLLEVNHMQVSFRSGRKSVQAIRDASFYVREREIMAIVGESGSGKSVLTQSCLRLLPTPPGHIDGGEVLFEGSDLLKLDERKLQKLRGKEISVIFQDAMTALNPTMRIGDQITEMLLEHFTITKKEAAALTREVLAVRDDPEAVEHWLLRTLRPTEEKLADDRSTLQELLHGSGPEQDIAAWLVSRGTMTRNQARKEALHLLESVKIPDPEKRINQFIFQCSGGMRQRVMIAMALSCRPKLVIADEPTTALDVTTKSEILDLLVELIQRLGTSVILITHDLGTVASYADRIGVMYGGQFMEQGTSEQIFYETLHPYTLGLMKAVPRLDLPHEQKLSTIPGNPPNLYTMPAGCPFSTRCKFCMEICKAQQPAETAFGDHTVRCWLYDERAAEMKKAFDQEKELLRG